MQISMKCSVAVHCLVFIHEAEGIARVTSTLLSKSTGCNPVTVRTVMSSLKKAGIVRTEVGGAGGTVLDRDPADITLYDIYHAVEPEGTGDLIKIHDCGSRPCPVAQNIGPVLEGPYRRIEDAVCETMRSITLAEILTDFHSRLAQAAATGADTDAAAAAPAAVPAPAAPANPESR